MSEKLKVPISVTVDKLTATLLSDSEIQLKTDQTTITCGRRTLKGVLESLEGFKENLEDDYGYDYVTGDDD